MKDQELQTVLRATLETRAATVASGPQWNADEHLEPPQHLRRSITLWAPIAAAAAVLVLVAGALALRPNDKRHAATPPTPGVRAAVSPSAQIPVPAGMKAVDAWGVEIFVPSSFHVDAPCGLVDTVTREGLPDSRLRARQGRPAGLRRS